MARGHALGGGPNLHEAEVARRLTERFPSMELIRFTMTGTEANTYAINTALAVTGRGKILVYDGAYHGAWIHGGVAAGPLQGGLGCASWALHGLLQVGAPARGARAVPRGPGWARPQVAPAPVRPDLEARCPTAAA